MVFRVEDPLPDAAMGLLIEHRNGELGDESGECFVSWYGPPKEVKNVKRTTTNREVGNSVGVEAQGVNISRFSTIGSSSEATRLLFKCKWPDYSDGPIFIQVPWPTDDGDIIVRLVYPEALKGEGAMVRSNPDGVYVIDATLPSHARGGYLAVHGLTMMSEDSQGPDHPGVATRLNSLALLLASDGRVQEAEEMYRRALDIARKVYGPEHADVATYLNNLARVLKAQDKLGEAEPLQRSALSIGERMLGTNHSDVATYYNNLSRLVRAAGKLEEAEPLQRRAVEIGEQVLGPNSSDLATWVNNLGRLLMARKKLEEAKEVQERAVAIAENVYGPDHPQVARARKNLTKVQVALNKADRSRGLGAPDTDMDA